MEEWTQNEIREMFEELWKESTIGAYSWETWKIVQQLSKDYDPFWSPITKCSRAERVNLRGER